MAARIQVSFEAAYFWAYQRLDALASSDPVAKAELERMRTELKQAYADRAQAHAAKFQVCEAADAVLTNEEHAFSGGMRSYKQGSPTWEVYDNLRRRLNRLIKQRRERQHNAPRQSCRKISRT